FHRYGSMLLARSLYLDILGQPVLGLLEVLESVFRLPPHHVVEHLGLEDIEVVQDADVPRLDAHLFVMIAAMLDGVGVRKGARLADGHPFRRATWLVDDQLTVVDRPRAAICAGVHGISSYVYGIWPGVAVATQDLDPYQLRVRVVAIPQQVHETCAQCAHRCPTRSV